MRPRQMYSRVSVEADRLTPDEAAHAAAQLPTELKALWGSAHPALAPPLKLHRREFLERVRLEAGLHGPVQAEQVTDAVFAALEEHLSDGEADDIMAQLPRDLKHQWARA